MQRKAFGFVNIAFDDTNIVRVDQSFRNTEKPQKYWKSQ